MVVGFDRHHAGFRDTGSREHGGGCSPLLGGTAAIEPDDFLGPGGPGRTGPPHGTVADRTETNEHGRDRALHTLLLIEPEGGILTGSTPLPRALSTGRTGSSDAGRTAHRPLDPILDARLMPRLGALPGSRPTHG